jgi:hypothetical protein
MKTGDRERTSSLYLAGNVRFIERAFGFQGNKACRRVFFVASLNWSLHRSQFSSIHIQAPSIWPMAPSVAALLAA